MRRITEVTDAETGNTLLPLFRIDDRHRRSRSDKAMLQDHRRDIDQIG